MRHVAGRSIDKTIRPLSEPVFLILTSLAHEPKHGYAVEMQAAFAARLDELKGHFGSRFRLAALELGCLVWIAAMEWIAKSMTDPSIRSRHLPDRMMRLPWVPPGTKRHRPGPLSC